MGPLTRSSLLPTMLLKHTLIFTFKKRKRRRRAKRTEREREVQPDSETNGVCLGALVKSKS